MGTYTHIYSIHVSDETRDVVNEAIRSFHGEITILETLENQIVFKADEITARTLAIKTKTDAYRDEAYEFLHNPLVKDAAKKLAQTAIQRAKVDPLPPVSGRPAERYMAQTHTDIFNTASVERVTSLLEKAGARIHRTVIPTLSVIFCDTTEPEKLEKIMLPNGWTLSKLKP